ncbi:hypothetical protein ACLI4Z_03690 [Natrialbaceae archaeon A-arb3/5]
MALRCSLLGHDYGESDVDREREERGSEVVVTVQEYEECLRCGNRNIVSENTEVTSLAGDADSIPDDPDLDPEHEPSADHANSVDSQPEDDVEIVDAEPTGSGASESPTQPTTEPDSAGDDVDLPTDESGATITDDGEILDDESSGESTDRDRDHGEWPESDDVGPPVEDEESESWPDTDDADELPDTDDADELPAEDDAVVLEHDESAAGSSTGTESIATASEIADAAAGADAQTDADAESGSGIERAEPAPIPGEAADSRSEDGPTEFYCPRCEYVAASDRASLRAGDICPDCRKGYLGERPL